MDELVITGNTITGDDYGISMAVDGGSITTLNVNSNTITSNNYGIYMYVGDGSIDTLNMNSNTIITIYAGICMYIYGGSIDALAVNRNSITTTGDGSRGMLFLQYNSLITKLKYISGNSIATNGANSHGIVYRNDSMPRVFENDDFTNNTFNVSGAGAKNIHDENP